MLTLKVVHALIQFYQSDFVVSKAVVEVVQSASSEQIATSSMESYLTVIAAAPVYLLIHHVVREVIRITI